MKIRSLLYHIKEGLKNIYRNRLFSLASIATITACLFLFGVFYSIVMNFQYMIQKAENEVCVTVFFDEGLTDTQIRKLGETISDRVEVSSIHYTSAEEAWENYKTEYFADYPDLAEGFKNDNPLANSSSYEVYLSDANMQSTLVTYLENLDGIRQVNRSEATATGLASAARLVGYVAIAVVVILLAVSIFLITNTIVIGITVRKDEISIMKYIGATDTFVNAPFFVEGITIGVLGSVIPLAILAYLYQNIVGYVLSKFSVLGNILVFMPSGDIFKVLTPVSIVLGMGIGIVGTFFAVRKHANV
ncbi:MAG: permease-like cell division protein FtsX [Eubacteriales bacterium]|nr:permease-like cell division protein FtsX [Eubacteriales bacterium]